MKGRSYLAILGISLWCLSGPLVAAEGEFRLNKIQIQLPEFPPTSGFTLKADKSSITFIPPKDAIVISDGDKREVQISSRDNQFFIILRPSSLDPSLAAPDSWNDLREKMKERFTDGEVSECSACCNSVGAGGCGFTIRRTTAYRMKLVTRQVFVPYAGGMLEVSITAPAAKFSAQKIKFDSFLNCLSVISADEQQPKAAADQDSVAKGDI